MGKGKRKSQGDAVVVLAALPQVPGVQRRAPALWGAGVWVLPKLKSPTAELGRASPSRPNLQYFCHRDTTDVQNLKSTDNNKTQ